jgi:hypothetical protein
LYTICLISLIYGRIYGYLRQFPVGKTVMPEAATEGCAGDFAADGNSAGDNIARNWAHIWPAEGGIAIMSFGIEISGTGFFLR